MRRAAGRGSRLRSHVGLLPRTRPCARATAAQGEREHLTAEAQDADSDSTPALYRAGLALRPERLTGLAETLEWTAAGDGVVSFAREGGFRCLVNLSPALVALPSGSAVLLGSGPLASGPSGSELVPGDTCVWFSGAVRDRAE
ncbi:DUF3459 domain-containing protein [Streptomyces sp. SPB162]|uniref:DUF3459 domain-containing protein n=1 Tax=Streptomyces sp. SPB162 TaxID=2940560 RepID=UPI00240569B1|nr:DUF3459 domain-containing protein [Streptomyces sp. SPB162]MDF9811234.1 hypothetical protein [Streptomyces sp. SPB162]